MCFVEEILRCLSLRCVVSSGEDMLRAIDKVLIHEMPGCVAEAPFTVVEVFRFPGKTKALQSPRQVLISAFLLLPAIELFLVSARWVCVVYGELSRHVRDVHMVETVRFHSFIIKPWAIACFPFGATDHAEFGPTSTRHMIAAMDELNGGFAVVAALPAFLFGDLDKFLCCWVFGALLRAVPLVVAETADFCLAALAFAVFSAMISSTARVDVYVCGLDPFAASTSGTVDAVLGHVLLIFLIPRFFKSEVEQLIDTFEGYCVCCAAFRGHMLRIGNGEIENAAEAGVAHAMGAFELDGSRYRYIGHTGQTFNSGNNSISRSKSAARIKQVILSLRLELSHWLRPLVCVWLSN